MFSFQAGYELLVDEDEIQDLMAKTGQVHGSLVQSDGKKMNYSDENGCKKVYHREIERLRRQEMATLYASLRSLLPLQYIKGKRSIADHIYEAAKYIKQLKNEISEESCNRDELRKLSSASRSSKSGVVVEDNNVINIERPSTLVPACSVTVRPCSGGLQILITCSFTDEGSMSLSTMLQLISRQELVVVRCVSAKVGQRLFHTINTEVCDLTCMDLSGLQEKLLTDINNHDIYY